MDNIKQSKFKTAAELFSVPKRNQTEQLPKEQPKTKPTQYTPSGMLNIDLLVPFANHPFKLYSGERFESMCRSIRELGVLTPVLVRPSICDGKFEILAGHNRVNAAKAVGMTEVPVIIMNGIADDEASLIVTETNLMQRGFEVLSYSERAISIKQHLDAVKAQGKRTDLLQTIKTISENMENTDGSKANSVLCPVDYKINNHERVGKHYELSASSIARYVRLNFLSHKLLALVDDESIPFHAGIDLSYLRENEQGMLTLALEECNYIIDIKKAATLRTLSEARKLNPTKIVQVLTGQYEKKPKAPPIVKIPYKLYSKFFDENIPVKEIEATIQKVLTEYFESNHDQSGT